MGGCSVGGKPGGDGYLVPAFGQPMGLGARNFAHSSHPRREFECNDQNLQVSELAWFPFRVSE